MRQRLALLNTVMLDRKQYIRYTCFWFFIFDNYLYFGLYLDAEIHFLLHINVFERVSYNVSQQNLRAMYIHTNVDVSQRHIMKSSEMEISGY